jgi:hypothetical protein
MAFNEHLHQFQDNLYNIIAYVSFILYILISLGISANAPQYLDTLQYYIKIYISLFLIIRFNPFRTVKFTELDTKIAFSAGLFLLATTAINNVLQKYLTNFEPYLEIFTIV